MLILIFSFIFATDGTSKVKDKNENLSTQPSKSSNTSTHVPSEFSTKEAPTVDTAADADGGIRSHGVVPSTDDFLINWSISESNTQVNPTTCLGDRYCWIQQVTAPTLVVTCWIQQSVCILHSSRTGGASPPCTSRG